MNAENVSVIDGDPFAGVKKPRFAALVRLVRALGFGQSDTPRRPVLRHPLERLIFHNFAIYEVYRGQPGRLYMSLSNVEIVRKLSLREFDTGQCEYRFELSAPADPIWTFYFRRLAPDLAVRFENKSMVLVCFPPDLESSYSQIKDGFAFANHWHADEREALLKKITAQDEAQQAMREMEENRKRGLQKQFDYLEL